MSFEITKSETFVGDDPDDRAQMSKRNEARQRVLLRAQLHAIERQGEVRVTDLSRSGLRGITDLSVGVDQSIFVSLDDMTHCSGTVRWTQERRVGVKFSKLLDVIPDTAQMDLGMLPSHRERMPRITTNLSAKIALCNVSCSAKIRNVSKSGMMVETDMELSTNNRLLVSLSDGQTLAATVKWVEGDRVGLQLSNPVSILQFTYGDFA